MKDQMGLSVLFPPNKCLILSHTTSIKIENFIAEPLFRYLIGLQALWNHKKKKNGQQFSLLLNKLSREILKLRPPQSCRLHQGLLTNNRQSVDGDHITHSVLKWWLRGRCHFCITRALKIWFLTQFDTMT